jgi:TatD DNase family protein
MQLVDTHTHLYLSEFDPDRDDVILRALDQGIEKFLLPNIDSSSIASMLELATHYPDHCYPMMGLHPTSVKKNYLSELALIRRELENKRFIAIGEVGIDLYRNKTHEQEQIDALSQQANLALTHGLPLVIHSRNSFDLIASILEGFNNPKLTGVFHSFTGNIRQAEKALSLGFKLGIGGIVTFKNSGLDAVVRKIDLSHIILETDSPYLAPIPNRGKRNESAYLVYVAEKIAQLHSTDIDRVAETTTRNAMSLFNMSATSGVTQQ